MVNSNCLSLNRASEEGREGDSSDFERGVVVVIARWTGLSGPKNLNYPVSSSSMCKNAS